jgi:anti-anti-sigma factor
MQAPDGDSRSVAARGAAPQAPRIALREISEHTTIVTLIGEHDLLTEQLLREQLEHARMASIVIVDLTRCTFLDSSIMAALLGARHARGPARRIDLVMPGHGTVAFRALHLTGVPEFFEHHATLDAALARAEAGSAHV